MNERLQELLENFLHRGCTPDEEKELFDACLHDPDAAETVRQQLILSLKIRKLRDEVEVPLETRNELFRKINAIAAEAPAEPERKRAFAWLGGLRLGWSHAVVAGAAAVLAVFMVMNSGTDTELTAPEQIITEVTDTVTIHSVDTLREIERVPVYIEKNIASDDVKDQVQPKDETVPAPDAVPEGTDLAQQVPVDGQTPADTEPSTGIATARDMKVTRSNFQAQYSDMVANTETIQLTEDDRVRL